MKKSVKPLSLKMFIFTLWLLNNNAVYSHPWNGKGGNISCKGKAPSIHFSVTGTILNYPGNYIYVYRCYGDTLFFVDSIKVDSKGNFAFSESNNSSHKEGLYRFNLSHNQWFYIVSSASANENQVVVKVVFEPNYFYNLTQYNVQIIKSEENKLFYQFVRLQKKVVVANFTLREMLRLFPYYDEYSKEMEKEYNGRYNDMQKLLEYVSKHKLNNSAAKIIKAYYTPNPNWREPDDWRDSIIAAHYFDYFDPADRFYLYTNILPEKIDNYFYLFSFLMRVNRETRSDYEKHLMKAADEFLKHTVSNAAVHEFCLQYILKKFDAEKMYDALYHIYSQWVYQANAGDCEQTNPAFNKWREKVSVLKNIQVGSVSPDFTIVNGKLNLYQLQADYTLLVFWASWCPHCINEIPEIKKIIEQFSETKKGKTLIPLFISLDQEENAWKMYIENNGIGQYIHLCEFKGWKSELVKSYNVYATPTMFLLDKNKQIIAKPEDVMQLKKVMEALFNP